MESRVRVATCRDGAEAALVKSLLEGHDIPAVVSGEHHAAVLGGIAGPFIQLDVWVDAEDAERAGDLIGSMRGGDEAVEAEDSGPEDEGPHWGLELRKRTGVALVLACMVTFGTGHLYARAWMRGITLAAIEIVGFGQADRPVLAATLISAAILLDAVGSVLRVRAQVREAQLPAARVLPRT